LNSGEFYVNALEHCTCRQVDNKLLNVKPRFLISDAAIGNVCYRCN